MKEKIQAFMAKRQAKGKRSYEIDMCNGPLLGKILRLSLIHICSEVLQYVCGRKGKIKIIGGGKACAFPSLVLSYFKKSAAVRHKWA